MVTADKVRKVVKLDSIYTPPVVNVDSENSYYIAAVKRPLNKPIIKNQLPVDIWDPIISNIGDTSSQFEIMADSDFIELNEQSRPMMNMISAAGHEVKIITVDKDAYETLLKSLRDLVDIILDGISKVEKEEHTTVDSMVKQHIIVELLTTSSSGIELVTPNK